MEQERAIQLKAEKKKAVINKYIFVWVMLAIPILNWVLFWLIVNVSSIKLAFQDARTGLFTWQNFVDFWESLTTDEGDLALALTNTAKYFFSGLLIVNPLSFFMAYFLYKKITFYRAFTVIFYLPAIISGVVMVQVYTEVLLPNGPLAQLFPNLLNIPKDGLLARSSTATTTIIFYTIWTGFGSNILLFIGAMTRIPLDILEAAKIEGCKPFRELIQVIFPLVWPTVSTMLILSFTSLLGSSGPILLFDPNNLAKTTTLSYWIFTQVYGSGTYGGTGSYNLVSATGLSFTLVAMPIILFIHWIVEKVPDVEY